MHALPSWIKARRGLGWITQLAVVVACGGEIAHSQHNRTTTPPPGTRDVPASPHPATTTRSAAEPLQADDELAADTAVKESEQAGSDSAAPTPEPAATSGATATTEPTLTEAPPLVMPVTIEDAQGSAMRAFHDSLRRAQAGEGTSRVLFYGASHVASDLFTGRIRRALQAQFGDGGAGFVMPAKPWPYYRNALVEHVESHGWHAPRVRARAPEVGRYGLAGVALEARDRPAMAKLRTRSDGPLEGTASRFELMYLKQPEGGRVRLVMDGKDIATLSTLGTEAKAAYFHFEAPDGPHEIELHTLNDGPVTVFGLSLERDRPGVVVDTVGIPGARVRYHLFWDDALYREHIAHRTPDLFVLAYGTNEAGDRDVPIESYESEMRDVIGRLRATAPNASCLLIGPSDRPEKHQDGTYSPRERVPLIVEAQRRTAQELGCGFFDLVAFMGGPMSMVRWASASPPFGAPDHVHYTRRGYEALGDALGAALTAGLEADPLTDPATPQPMR